MHDAIRMRKCDGVGNLPRDLQGFLDRQRPARDALRQCVAGHELEHQQQAARGIFDTVDGADARVVQGREEARFAIEPGQPLRVLTDRPRQPLVA